MAKNTDRRGADRAAPDTDESHEGQKDPLQVLELRAENFAILRAVRIRPAGPGLVEITGRNENGKSTVLRALRAAMEGHGAAPLRALRDGTDEGFLEADCGRLKVRREIVRRPDGSESWSLRVTLDGRPVRTSPQAVINGFLGALGFDPLAFARAKPREQVDRLKALVPGVDFDALQRRRADLFGRRTDVGRDRDRERAAAEAIELPPGPKPKLIDVGQRVQEVAEAERRNADIAQRLRRREEARAEAERKRDEAETLRAKAATLEQEAAAIEARLAAAGPPPAFVDTQAMMTEIAFANAANSLRAMHETRERHEAAHDRLRAEYERLTQEITALDDEKRRAIESARLPVDGLEITDDGVLVHGVPFQDAALSRKIRVSMAIAMAANPGLRIVLIDEGSELDAASRAEVDKMAREHGFEVWITRVDETGECGFVIQDGEVVRSPEGE
jgi:AAA domain